MVLGLQAELPCMVSYSPYKKILLWTFITTFNIVMLYLLFILSLTVFFFSLSLFSSLCLPFLSKLQGDMNYTYGVLLARGADPPWLRLAHACVHAANCAHLFLIVIFISAFTLSPPITRQCTPRWSRLAHWSVTTIKKESDINT